jgi:hypothetical protein
MHKDQRSQIIRALKAARKMSAGMLALEFENCTRNAILGHCLRNDIKLDFSRGEASPLWRDGVRSQRAGKPEAVKPKALYLVGRKAKPMQMPEPEPVPATSVPFVALENGMCRWPLWERLPSQAASAPCCGASTSEGKHYCSHHAALSRRAA